MQKRTIEFGQHEARGYIFTASPAKYSKGQVLIRSECQEGFGGQWKTRVHRLLEALHARYTHRERGYVLSHSKASKLLEYLTAGWDAGIFGELKPPRKDAHDTHEVT